MGLDRFHKQVEDLVDSGPKRAPQVSAHGGFQPHRCWDGHIGCLEQKMNGAFRYHRLICDSCSTQYAARYGIMPSDISILTLTLAMEASLLNSCVANGAAPHRMKFLRDTEEERVKNLVALLLSVWKGKDAAVNVGRTYMDYRKSVYRDAGVTQPVGSKDMEIVR